MPPKQLKTTKSSPQKRKHTQRNESARRRLRVAFDEDDTSSTNDLAHTEDEGPPLQKHQFLQSPRKSNTSEKCSPKSTKRRKRGGQPVTSVDATVQQKMQSESFIMKLFDRSLDLSMYTQKTALYPICRAWMMNRPRSAAIRNYRDSTSPVRVKREDIGVELLDKLQRGWVDIYSMPKPKGGPVAKSMMPQPKVVEIKAELDKDTPDGDATLGEPVENKQPDETNNELTKHAEVKVKQEKDDEEVKETGADKVEVVAKKPWESLIDSDQSHESILVDLKEKWTLARKRGQLETHRAYHKRYETNRKIIEMLYVQTSVLKQSTLHQNRH